MSQQDLKKKTFCAFTFCGIVIQPNSNSNHICPIHKSLDWHAGLQNSKRFWSPKYTTNLFLSWGIPRPLRSSETDLLSVLRVRKNSQSELASGFYSPEIWIKLPNACRLHKGQDLQTSFVVCLKSCDSNTINNIEDKVCDCYMLATLAYLQEHMTLFAPRKESKLTFWQSAAYFSKLYQHQ